MDDIDLDDLSDIAMDPHELDDLSGVFIEDFELDNTVSELKTEFPVQEPYSKSSMICEQSDSDLELPETPYVQPTLDTMTIDMRDLVRKVQHLSHLGIEDSRIALPKICVVGDQSTGKSSLIEAISEIRVPRSADTCTRCPMEIVLRDGDLDQPWKCVVSLVQPYYYDPQKQLRSTNPRVDKSEYLGPWLRKANPDEEEFITLSDKDQIQDVIWRAQLATLNPTSDFKDFLPPQDIENAEIEIKFAPNVIRLDISGPNLPNLSFYDLPGVINQADDDREKYVVGLVQKLVKSYVSQDNCIVLLTQSMTDDASNSSAGRLIREVKGAKERTIGVMTKPDRLERNLDAHKPWVEIMRGRKFRFGLGWFVVKNNPDPKVDHVKAREEEEEFFSGPYWNGIRVEWNHRFGVRFLQGALSTELMAQIKKSLPSIMRQIKEKSERISRELKTLPDPPVENFQFILVDKVVKLGQRYESLFGDGHESEVLQRPWNELMLDFQKALDRTRPLIMIQAKSDKNFFEKIDSDCEVIAAPNARAPKRKAPAVEVNSKVQGEQSHQPPPEKKVFLTKHFNDLAKAKRFQLEMVQNLKQECQRAGVPNQVDPRAIQKLNRMSIEHWKDVGDQFAAALHVVVQHAVLKTLDDVMSMYKQTALYREFQKIIEDFLSRVQDDYETDLKAYFEIEHSVPFTMAQAEHKEKSGKVLAELMKSRQHSLLKSWLRARGFGEDDKAAAQAELGPDPFAQELEMVAVSLSTMTCGFLFFLLDKC